MDVSWLASLYGAVYARRFDTAMPYGEKTTGGPQSRDGHWIIEDASLVSVQPLALEELAPHLVVKAFAYLAPGVGDPGAAARIALRCASGCRLPFVAPHPGDLPFRLVHHDRPRDDMRQHHDGRIAIDAPSAEMQGEGARGDTCCLPV